MLRNAKRFIYATVAKHMDDIKTKEEAEANRQRKQLFNTQNFFGMINEQEMLDLFQVEELEKRYEMGWIRVSAQGSETGTNIGGSDHGTIGPMTQYDENGLIIEN